VTKQFSYTLVRYSLATTGLLLVALGVALSIISNLGTAPLSCPAYILSAGLGLTVGNWTIIVNTSYILVQLLVLRRGFKLKYLMQIPASLVFGYLIDLCMMFLQWIQPGSFADRLLIIVAACAVTAVGVSIEVIAQAWMLSAEMTVYAFAKTIHKSFGNIKIVMDSSQVVISLVISLLIFRNPFGGGEYTGILPILSGQMDSTVIGIGTLICAVLPGWMMRFSDPLVDKLMDKIFEKMVSE